MLDQLPRELVVHVASSLDVYDVFRLDAVHRATRLPESAVRQFYKKWYRKANMAQADFDNAHWSLTENPADVRRACAIFKKYHRVRGTVDTFAVRGSTEARVWNKFAGILIADYASSYHHLILAKLCQVVQECVEMRTSFQAIRFFTIEHPPGAMKKFWDLFAGFPRDYTVEVEGDMINAYRSGWPCGDGSVTIWFGKPMYDQYFYATIVFGDTYLSMKRIFAYNLRELECSHGARAFMIRDSRQAYTDCNKEKRIRPGNYGAIKLVYIYDLIKSVERELASNGGDRSDTFKLGNPPR